ncbi:MAG: hypothetical protein IKK84_03355 [Clostridia bacterium]|nr:hypothetical protein [Clostridia bacterium]
MYNQAKIQKLVDFVNNNKDLVDKAVFKNKLQSEFNLKTDRTVYYCDDFAVRVSYSKTATVSNTVLGLAKIKAYDNIPLFVIVVSPANHKIVLANSTCVKKVSHSSHKLTLTKIIGSINFSDISSEIFGIKNIPENFEEIFNLHLTIGFNNNLKRLVDATSNIEGYRTKIHCKQF